MQEILMIATIVAPITTALVEAVKKGLKPNERIMPLVAVVIGILLGAAAYFVDAERGMRLWAGGISGLAATGLFEVGQLAQEDVQTGKCGILSRGFLICQRRH